jgi:hypothetical protein
VVNDKRFDHESTDATQRIHVHSGEKLDMGIFNVINLKLRNLTFFYSFAEGLDCPRTPATGTGRALLRLRRNREGMFFDGNEPSLSYNRDLHFLGMLFRNLIRSRLRIGAFQKEFDSKT